MNDNLNERTSAEVMAVTSRLCDIIPRVGCVLHVYPSRVYLVTQKARNLCLGCYYFLKDGKACGAPSALKCCKNSRPDRQNVIFTELADEERGRKP